MRTPASRLTAAVLNTGLLIGMALTGAVKATSPALALLGLSLLAGLPATAVFLARVRDGVNNRGIEREHRTLRFQAQAQRVLAVVFLGVGAWSLWEVWEVPSQPFLRAAGLLVVPALAASGFRWGLDRSLPTATLEGRRGLMALGGMGLILGAALGLRFLPGAEALATLLLAIWTWAEGQAAARAIALPKASCCGGCGGGCH